ncbi:MAG: hypothetical protein GY700_04240, partial [Propionibacteriaceae bacterium]|nr:hypothetical protein [Propionibacteriaceae bacterium]
PDQSYIETISTPDARWELLAFGISPAINYDRPDFFEDVKVRQAIALCIDRQAVANQVTGLSAQALHSYLPPGHPLYAGDALTTWVSADPTDYDTDDDTILDNFEYIYGYNPNAPSTLNVLSLRSGLPGGNAVLPGASLAYTATIENELDNRYARGMLQAEFPTDVVQSTNVMDILPPRGETTMVGQVTVSPDIAASTYISLTLRAGAIIEEVDTGRLVWLHLNEAYGATFFADDSLTGHDATCSGGACPTANDGYVDFSLGDAITPAGPAADFQLEDFTVGAWLYPTSAASNAEIYDIPGFSFYLDT